MRSEESPMVVRLDVETQIEWVEVVLGVFERRCTQCGYELDAIHSMGTAVREALTDGMRLGNRMDPGKRLRIEIETRSTAAGGPAVEVAIGDERGSATLQAPSICSSERIF